MARARKIAFDRRAQAIEAHSFQQHPHFERSETPRQFRTIVPTDKRLVCLLAKHARVFSLMSESRPRNLWVAVNYAANVHREIKPFVRIKRDRICLLHPCE